MFVERAQNQIDQINAFSLKRFPLLKAFRRLKEGDIPGGTTGLSKEAVMAYAAELYRIDGLISYDRAKLFGAVVNSFSSAQKANMDALKALNGIGNWDSSLSNPLEGLNLPQDVNVAVSTELRKFLASQTADSSSVIALSERYGELDGEISYYYATTFSQVYNTLSDEQKTKLAGLADQLGYIHPTGAFQYSQPIAMPEIMNTDFMFK